MRSRRSLSLCRVAVCAVIAGCPGQPAVRDDLPPSRSAPAPFTAARSPTAPAAPAVDKVPAAPAVNTVPAAPEPAEAEAPAAASGARHPSAKPPPKAHVRTIHPQPGASDCIEMYGSCTPLPDRICTTSAYVLDCGESGQRPGSHEWLTCVCSP